MRRFRTKVQFHAYVLGSAALILIMILLQSFGNAAAQGTPTRTPTPRVQQTQEPGPDVTVIISERYFNQLVDEALEERPDLQNPVVDLKEDATAEVAATMPLLYGVSVRPRAMMTLAVVNGQIRATITSFELNGMGVPRSIVNSRMTTLENELNLAINRELVSQLKPAGLRLTGLETHENQMNIEMQAVQQVDKP